MKKQCITHREFKLILDDLRKETPIILEGSDTFCDEDREKNFYYVKFHLFETFPMFIGKLHETYGRDIDVRTYWADNDIIQMYIRGYIQEMK